MVKKEQVRRIRQEAIKACKRSPVQRRLILKWSRECMHLITEHYTNPYHPHGYCEKVVDLLVKNMIRDTQWYNKIFNT